ncbi:TIGR04086 family membrane protein [Arthrobacter sp.]|uniref:TIGR04086 family membrane protein n=1 Tax=Arthrobacter sp. TaxID=1667 RepID=UPI0028966C6E|nr:TIGR04086 family membrane protein [Arthrobacter sp.]
MSTDSGSTAAGDRRRQAEDLAAREDETAKGNEPDVTRRLDTGEAAGPRQNDTEVLGAPGTRGNRPNDTEVLGTRGTRQNDTEVLGAPGTRRNDTQVLGTADTRRYDAEVTGTRDPNDAAYRTGRTTPEQAEVVDRHERTGRGPRAQGLPNREALLAAERERFGGMKFGSAFFGWLTATGMVVLLSAAAAAIGAAVGVSTDTDLGAALDQASADQSAGLVGAIIALAVLLLAYYAGGYVAGRMARFNGLKQGLAVWLWALVAAAVVIIVGLIFGNDIRSITQLNSVAPLPQDLGSISGGAWLALAASLTVSLVGALLGGLAGMRFHRRVDRAQFPPAQAPA